MLPFSELVVAESVQGDNRFQQQRACILFGTGGVYSTEAIGRDMIAREKLDELIETHSAKAYQAACRLTGNQADACDLVQEAFLRIIEKKDLFDPGFDFGGWMYRVMFRVYLNSRRSRERLREVPLEPEAGSVPAAGAGSPEKAAENSELGRSIGAALAGLPAELRACVVLVDMEGMDYEFAAETLGCPVGSVAGRLFRARRALRAALGPMEGI